MSGKLGDFGREGISDYFLEDGRFSDPDYYNKKLQKIFNGFSVACDFYEVFQTPIGLVQEGNTIE